MGTAMAERLRPHHDVRTWTRSAGGSPADAVARAEVVLLCLYDAQACRDVLAACLPSMLPTAVVVNTTTVGARGGGGTGGDRSSRPGRRTSMRP